MAGMACVFVLLLVALLTYSGNSALTEKALLGLTSLIAGAFGGYCCVPRFDEALWEA